MKKIFTLFAVAAMAISAYAQAREWNVSDWELATYEAETVIDGFTIYATASGSVTVDASNKTVDGVRYTQRVKTGGAGSLKDGVYSRILSFDIPGNGEVLFIATSSNSTDARKVGVAFGEFIAFPADETEIPEGLNSIDVAAGDPQVKTVEYIGDATKVFIYSKSGGVNFYDFRFTPDASTAIAGISVDDADAPVEYFNLQGLRVENPHSGLYIRRQGNKVGKIYLK